MRSTRCTCMHSAAAAAVLAADNRANWLHVTTSNHEHHLHHLTQARQPAHAQSTLREWRRHSMTLVSQRLHTLSQGLRTMRSHGQCRTGSWVGSTPICARARRARWPGAHGGWVGAAALGVLRKEFDALDWEDLSYEVRGLVPRGHAVVLVQLCKQALQRV
jgi:hypothetical protein